MKCTEFMSREYCDKFVIMLAPCVFQNPFQELIPQILRVISWLVEVDEVGSLFLPDHLYIILPLSLRYLVTSSTTVYVFLFQSSFHLIS